MSWLQRVPFLRNIVYQACGTMMRAVRYNYFLGHMAFTNFLREINFMYKITVLTEKKTYLVNLFTAFVLYVWVGMNL